VGDFFERLKQRKLVQWALAYAAAAFALIQVLDIVAQRFGWPESVERFAIVAMAVGFFLTLVLAWYHGERGAQKTTSTELLILTLLLTIGGVVAWRLAPAPNQQVSTSRGTTAANAASAAAIPDKSVAVLPFENLSSDKDNAFFAAGMQDEVITKLAKIGALKVISRTSTQHYASSPDNLPEIARELGVANILEGSVQRAGDLVHINVQLIHAATDDHLWAEVYDRKLDNIFGVEGEVAGTIAEKLNAKLTGAEQAAIEKKPTENLAAYDAYLRGRALELTGYDFDNVRQVAMNYLDAVREDPKFALAWSHLAQMAGYLYFNHVAPQKYTAEMVKQAADTAIALQPDLVEAKLSQATYMYRRTRA
jgi:TolB-like protein